MHKAHYLYFPNKLENLEKLIESFQKEFQTLLEDSFSEIELERYDDQIELIAVLYVQPIIEELTFDDLNADPLKIEEQKIFYENCKSSICIENLPFFESNPFQVSYLLELLKKFDDVLIDRGGSNTLLFKEEFITILNKYKKMDKLMSYQEVVHLKKNINPVTSHIDFMMADIYQELNRLEPELIKKSMVHLNEKAKKILNLMILEKLDSDRLFFLCKQTPKDFDDHLEKVKFFLKKL